MKTREYVDKNGKFKQELILSPKEEERWYSACIQRVLNNTRFVLDKLDTFPEFKVKHTNYGKNRKIYK